jgi:rifampicin phosphotransferase
MSTFILPLADTKATLETVGGKGLSLAKMIQAGFPIPCGFHITTEAYRAFIEANGLQTKILAALNDVDSALPATLEFASTAIGGFFADAAIPSEIADSIRNAYLTLNTLHLIPVAVRSSATAEDLPEASFAGQQETFLNIRGEEALLDAVKKCWTSLWTARAIAYRIKNNIDQNTVALAVVVQEMVDAESSGILFTANPINGHRDEMVINAAWGLGEAIVGGLVSPDTITANKGTGKIKGYEVAEKTVITVTTKSGTREEPLNDARRRSQVLTEADVVRLVDIARKIENFYSRPQDIEWCCAKGNFYIVQSRPITALPPEPVQWPVPRPKLMLARGSLAEHLPNAVSPLFGTLGLRTVNKATLELSDFMGGIDLLEVEYQYRVINGYVFFGFLMSAKFMWAMIKVTFRSLGLMFGRSKERWLEAREAFANAIAPWEKKQVENLSPCELLEGTRALMYTAGKYYTVIQSSTLPSSSMSEIAFTNLYKMIRGKHDPKAETMLFGLETVPLRAEKSLFDLGMWMRERPALRNLMLHTPTEELVAALGADSHPKTISVQEWDELQCRLEKHADEFGHTSFEFDFMNPTPAETPKLILDSIKMYVEGKGSDPYARQRKAIAKRERTVKKIRSRFKLIPNRWFNKALQWAMDTAPAREDSLADMGMGHATIRCMLGELGKRFVANGALENTDDIYWLVEDEVDELASLLERSEKLHDYSGKVTARKAEWREQMKLVPPAILPEKSGWAKLIPWARKNESGNVIKGLGASAGKVTATACVMFTPEDFHKMKPGDVLVAVITTPAWTPLFTMASAIVTDIGGPLSHSSIVAREYGIPAVLATGSGTRRIQNGQTITVDGSAGTVTLS